MAYASKSAALAHSSMHLGMFYPTEAEKSVPRTPSTTSIVLSMEVEVTNKAMDRITNDLNILYI